ncbi:MAG: glycosyltransferase family 2 protein [Dehalococcoidia bacterium]
MIESKPFSDLLEFINKGEVSALPAPSKTIKPQSFRQRYGICAIIPAYNEGRTIGLVIRETMQYVDKVFVIDDCSNDNTAMVAAISGAEVVRHTTNMGPGAALCSGCKAAIANGFQYVVQVDADGQHDPKYIPEMFSIAKDCDMVIGSRFLNGSYRKYPFIRRLGISFFTRLVNLLTGIKVTDVTSGYRVFRTESLLRLSPVPNRHWAVAQTMEAGRKGLKIKEVSTEMPLRGQGHSQFSLKAYILYPLRVGWVVVKMSLSRQTSGPVWEGGRLSGGKEPSRRVFKYFPLKFAAYARNVLS